jgi:hypothetical protein
MDIQVWSKEYTSVLQLPTISGTPQAYAADPLHPNGVGCELIAGYAKTAALNPAARSVGEREMSSSNRHRS